MTPVIAVLCAVGMVLVVPLGLRLTDDGTDPAARAWARLWPLAGGVGALSLVLPRGGVAAGLALMYAGATVALVGAVVLTVGMWIVAVLVWRDVRPASASALTRNLFAVSSVVLAATMLLALSWAAGQVWDAVPHLSVTAMAATHGVANALGFGVCGLLAWKRLADERAAVPTPSP